MGDIRLHLVWGASDMSLWQHKFRGPILVLLLSGVATMTLPAQDALQRLNVPLNSGWEFRQLVPAVTPATAAPASSSGTSTAAPGAPQPTTSASTPASGA